MNKVILEITDCRKCNYAIKHFGVWDCEYSYDSFGYGKHIPSSEDMDENIIYPIPDWCPLLNGKSEKE